MPRPNTSVRPPVLVGVRGRKLSELLRAWRRQPRKRSPVLFGALAALAAATDLAIVVVGVHLPRAAVPRLPAPETGNIWESLHSLATAFTCAALGLAWGMAAFALARIMVAPTGEGRLGRMTCVLAVTAMGLIWHLVAAGVPAAWVCEGALLSVALVIHAALRYYFGRQRTFAS